MGWAARLLDVVPHGGRQWRDYLTFPARVRADASARRDYEAAKRALAGLDRASYQDGKRDVVEAILSDD